MADRMGGRASCNDRCGRPSPCPGGMACRISAHRRRRPRAGPITSDCGCNPCTCTVTGTGKPFCKCGTGCTCVTCTS
ncbi:metallothionein-like protein 4B [Hibiscus syriacus]|uniref:metallothionein-like protein 4B n=1 Tax=Hibiscus syriacus TaxID=106335 RepID=UPI0019243E9D|nr:metallothionein-like protein 4B [Hibiscus syriacus]